jgi:hypothetical protein
MVSISKVTSSVFAFAPYTFSNSSNVENGADKGKAGLTRPEYCYTKSTEASAAV